VLADRSAAGLSPQGWAARVAEAAREFGALEIVAEKNQGGEMVRTVLAQEGRMTEHQTRRIPTALLVAVVVQTIGGLVWAGGAAARIAALEDRVGEQRLVAERLARLEEQNLATRAAVERGEVRLEGGR